MPQRNPTGGLLLLAAVAGGIYLASRKKKDTEPKEWPGEANTGWAVNPLCTNADLMDADTAVDHADAWFDNSSAPPLPVSPSPANTGTLSDGIAVALDRYFSDIFPQCGRAPSSLLFGDVVVAPEGLAAQTAQMLQKMSAGLGASGDRLNHFAAALVGH